MEHGRGARLDPAFNFMCVFYPRLFDTKLFLQSKTLVGRLSRGARLELTDPV
jgi:hypothetical protein